MPAQRATTGAVQTSMQGKVVRCKRALYAAAVTFPNGSESQTHPKGLPSTWDHPAVHEQRHLPVGSLGSGRLPVAIWFWSSRQRIRWRDWKADSHDEAQVLGAAYAIRWHSGSDGTEAIGSPLRNIHAPRRQHGTAHRMEPATELAAAPGQQVRGCCEARSSTMRSPVRGAATCQQYKTSYAATTLPLSQSMRLRT